MTPVCKAQDLTFFQVGLLRATGFNGTGEAGGKLLRDLLNRRLNPGSLEVWALGIGVLEGELAAATMGSACVVVTKETVVSRPMKVMIKRMCFMILADSVVGRDKTEVTFCPVSSSKE
jgi:hypothetical protein